ncbi:MAG TPA: hypothetical protein VGM26_18525 [Rhizomicrobium sp.]
MIMYVTYAGNADTPFDREHWIDVHLRSSANAGAPMGWNALAASSRRTMAAG